MAKFDDYSRSYRFIKMERRGGILQMTLHTDGGPLQWNLDAQVEVRARVHRRRRRPREPHRNPHRQRQRVQRSAARSGHADSFTAPKLTPGGVHEVFVNARKMVNAVLGIEVPMIAAVNGPAKRHADLALMCDIVIAADDVTFEDTAHFHNGGIVPGDGINVVYTMLMGLNRARYLMLTGQVLNAREAKDIGLVAELMPREKLLPRAWQLAEQLAKKNDMLLRYTRMVLTHPLRKQLDEGLQYFLAMEALSTLDKAQ